MQISALVLIMADRNEMSQIKNALTSSSPLSSLIHGSRKSMMESLESNDQRQVNALRNQMYELQKLNEDKLDENDNLLEKIRELNYDKQSQQHRYNKLHDQHKADEIRYEAAIHNLKQALENANHKDTFRDTTMMNDCNQLLRTIASLEKHSLHGHHVVDSKITIGLLLKAKHCIHSLKSSIDSCYKYENSNSSSNSKGGEVSASVTNSDAEAAVAADEELIEMCSYLKSENTKLIAANKTLEDGLQMEKSVSKLIPHYRLAIVSMRSKMVEVSEKLLHEKNTTVLLREQVDELMTEQRKLRIIKSKGNGTSAPLVTPVPAASNVKVKDSKVKQIETEIGEIDKELALLKHDIEIASRGKMKLVLANILESINNDA